MPIRCVTLEVEPCVLHYGNTVITVPYVPIGPVAPPGWAQAGPGALYLVIELEKYLARFSRLAMYPRSLPLSQT